MFFSEKPKHDTKSSIKVTGQGSSSITTLDSMVIPMSSIHAELLWTLKVVSSHFSLRSCLGLNKLFRVMFSDSKIASLFQKCEYFITNRLVPHFKELLLKDVNLSPFFVLSFDESLNEIIQKEQMDLQIRYWDNTQKKVCTRYLGSYFLQRPNAKNLCDFLISSLKELIP